MAQPISAFGIALQIGDGADPEVFTEIAEVTNLTGPGMSAAVIDVTSHDNDSAWREKLATLLDPGEITLELNFVPTEDTHDATSGLVGDFQGRTRRSFKLVFPDAGSTTWEFAGYVTAFSPSGPVDGALTASCTITIDGVPTLA